MRRSLSGESVANLPRCLKRPDQRFSKLGILCEWENPTSRCRSHYEAETARLFARFVERGFVTKERARLLVYSRSDRTGRSWKSSTTHTSHRYM